MDGEIRQKILAILEQHELWRLQRLGQMDGSRQQS